MKLLPLTRGLSAMVDDADFDRCVAAGSWQAYSHKNKPGKFYGIRQEKSGRHFRSVMLHRFIMDAPHGLEVDHKDGNGLDCRRSNLRLATHAQNMANRRKSEGTLSAFKGVGRRRFGWIASIGHVGRQLYLGHFKTQEDAARAYDTAATRLHGEFARLNFPAATSLLGAIGALLLLLPNGMMLARMAVWA